MGKKKKEKKEKHVFDKNTQEYNADGSVKKVLDIPKEVNEMMKLLELGEKGYVKKKRKKNSDWSKSYAKSRYYDSIIDVMPETISFMIRYGHLVEAKAVRERIHNGFAEKSFVKYFTKEIEKEDLTFDNMILLPIIIHDMCMDMISVKEQQERDNPGTSFEYDVSDIVKLSEVILKSKIKKLRKKSDVDKELALDLLSVIPDVQVMRYGANYRIRSMMDVMYAHAVTKDIDFKKVVSVLFADNEKYYADIIRFALLERKEKYAKLTSDTQKKLYQQITDFCFNTLEEMPQETIRSILRKYANIRQQDEKNGKDTNRRYYISSLPEKDYKRILKAVESIIDENEDLKKYF